MGANPRQPLEHLQIAEQQFGGLALAEALGQQRGRLGVGVQDGTGTGLFDDGQMQQRLGAGLALAPLHLARCIHHDQFFRCHRTLGHAARCHQ